MDTFSDPTGQVKPDHISVHLSGGLGNQMFQYMAGHALSEQMGKELLVNRNWFSNPWLRHRLNPSYLVKRKMDILQFSTVSKAHRDRTPTPSDGRFERGLARFDESQRRRFGVASEESFNSGSWNDANDIRRLIGYFMSPKYFLGTRPTKIFESLVTPVSAWTSSMMPTLANQESIGVHIRLGDYVALGDKVIPQEDYFLQGIESLRSILGVDAKVFFFTDEPSKLEALFPKLVRLGEIVSPPTSTTPVENLILLSKCSAFVCSNSTFSWWATTLNQVSAERIVRPSYFFTETPDIDTQADLWDPHSLKIHPVLGEIVE